MSSSWKFIRAVAEGEACIISGSDIWQLKWIDSGKKTTVTDPQYQQSFLFPVYTAGENGFRFAAGEFSNGVWGFFTEEENS